MSQIYEKILLFRKPNYYGLRMPLHFRHNAITPYLFNKEQKTLLFVWNNICYHKIEHRLKPHEITDDTIIELVTMKLSAEICGVLRAHVYTYLKELESLELIMKFGKTYIVNPYYCNSLSQGQKDYVVKRLQSLALDTELPE